MGCDIHGWVEVKQYPQISDYWTPAINIEAIVGRNYDMFGLLFGVRNYGAYEPIAEERGLPTYKKFQVEKADITVVNDDRSQTIIDLEKWGEDAHSISWISLTEIERIDWEKESEEIDKRVHQYELQQDGTLKYVAKFQGSIKISDSDYQKLEAGEELRMGTSVFRLEKLKLNDALSGDWRTLFDLMRILGRQHNNTDHVRLVVWFDN